MAKAMAAINRILDRFAARIEEARSRRRTLAFLDAVWGTWAGDESAEEILQAAKNHSSKAIYELDPLRQ